MKQTRPVTVFLASFAPLFQVFTFVVASYNGVLFSTVFCIVGVIMLLASLVTASIIKRIVHKKRPPKRQEYFKPFGTYAFPSGHATGMVAIAMYIFFSNQVLGLISFIVALIVMIARVRARVHDIYDMLGGAMLGLLFAYIAHLILVQLHMLHLL
jgi:membrane-associated phospholipid phosphatase